MNAVGIDVSKGKSTVAVLRPFGEVVASPFDVIHNDNDLKRLVKLIRSLPDRENPRLLWSTPVHILNP